MPRLTLCSLGLAFVPGLPRVGAAVQRTGAERRPRPVATPQGRRAHIGSDLFPFNPLEEANTRGLREQRVPYRHTDEARRKISAANKGNVPWNKGRKHSEETRRKIAAATKMAMRSPHVRERLREQALGRKHSEETKRKIRYASRMLHGNASDFTARKTRNRVPFKFSAATVAALDSRISKRFKKEYVDGSLYSEKGGVRRPMSEATKKKLSARIKEMWASPDYRERVLHGIEESNRNKEPRSPLSESHKEAIRQTLLKRNAELRKLNGTDKPRPRRPRSTVTPLDPTEGTRFSDRNMSSKSLRERDERRRRTAQILFEAEQEENDEVSEDPEARADRLREEAENEATRLREAQMQQEADRQLLESLARAGQLPPLDEEGAMFGSFFDSSGEHAGRDTSSLFDFGLGMRTGSPFFGNGLDMDDSGPLKDPLRCPPEPSLSSRSYNAGEHSFNDIFISADEQCADNSSVPLSSSPSIPTKSTLKARSSVAGGTSVQDDTTGISLTESVPLGQRLAYGMPDDEEGDLVDDVDEDDEDASDLNEEEELSIADTIGIIHANELSNSLGSATDSRGSSGYGNELDDVVTRSSSLLQSIASRRRIVTYINGERVLQSTTSL